METETPVYERIVLKLSGEAMQERGARDNISLAVVREIGRASCRERVSNCV